ncbi:hypothetical protein B0H15DRAFT_823853 [Mycena belliarum]|uniref:Uncharacterized protein n=1 Tax=Mycena belliarum TaxID=1033014 RepID=A0AAD6XV52_9AGAR|nr:hypothetical protein B0H15DRAFT_823853 [Mycena belliae]
MLPVVSPQPRLASPPAAAIYSMTTSPPLVVLTTPLRLQSPILLDPRLRSPARSHCNPLHRRRAARPRRRRHCARADCPVESVLHPFDRLPWISAMDARPDTLDPIDIADLSQLVVDDPLDQCGALPPVSGPIRRRKTSLRPNPLALKPPALHEIIPHTPLSHINHSRIHFQNLMPVFSCDHAARP